MVLTEIDLYVLVAYRVVELQVLYIQQRYDLRERLMDKIHEICDL